MKKIALFVALCFTVSACDQNVDNADDLNSIPEEVGNVTPEA